MDNFPAGHTVFFSFRFGHFFRTTSRDFQPEAESSASDATSNVGRSVPSPSRSTSKRIRSRLSHGTSRLFNTSYSSVTTKTTDAPKLSANSRFALRSALQRLGVWVPVRSYPLSALPGSPDNITTMRPCTSKPA